MMAYTSWSVVFGEQPSAAKWNILGTNDASFNDGSGLNTGSVQQHQYTTYTAVQTGTTIIPYDTSIPQSTEGDQYMSQVITPKATTNILVIEANILFSGSVVDHLIAALFQDSGANAIAATSQFGSVGTDPQQALLTHVMAAGTTSATTFKLRAGGNNAGTMTFNGTAGANQYGAIVKSSIRVTEFKA